MYEGGVACSNASPPRAFPWPQMRPFLPDMGKNTGNLAANFSVFSNFYVANVKIRGCCINVR